MEAVGLQKPKLTQSAYGVHCSNCRCSAGACLCFASREVMLAWAEMIRELVQRRRARLRGFGG